MSQRRLPRFTRAPIPRSIRITKRDCEIIECVARHRFLRSTHVVALTAGSTQQVLRRLQLLYHHGYLERPRAQVEYFNRGGSHHIVYGLGSKGAKFLAPEFGNAFGEKRWGDKNRSVRRMFLQHALLVSDVLVAFELACRDRTDIRYIPQRDFFPTALRWSVNLEGARKLGVVPDAAFALEWTKSEGTTERAFFFLEADRGTMPVSRKALAQTSFLRKFLAYEATWSHGIHRSRLGLHRFRVLTVATSEARLRSLRHECSKLRTGKGLFLFLHKDALTNPASLLGAAWARAQEGEPVSLLD